MPLPTYKNYYVDYRLKQFRSCADFPAPIEFLDFDSEKGDELLAEMIRQDLVPSHILCQIV